MMNETIRLKPLYKERVWGGRKLESIFNRQLPKDSGLIGESWDVVDRDEDQSLVIDGEMQGMTLNELWVNHKELIFGTNLPQTQRFPLLVKVLDATEKLSVQVHPPESIVSGLEAEPKTEMWYIMHTRPEARLVLGFDPIMDEDSYQTHVAEGTLTEILNNEPVSAGDAFFIPPGTVHAIGSGVLLAEIQQTSDVTYRIFDWNRPDAQGNFRELHTEEALDAIDFSPFDARISYQDVANKPVVLASNEYFETRKWKLDTTQRIAAEERDSFTVWMCVEGNAIIKTQTSKISLSMGATVLIPACLKSYQIETTGATLLEVYIP